MNIFFYLFISYPTHEIGGSENNPDWLYSTLADYFSSWLPQESLDQFKIEGSYSLQIKPGFRIISINSNMCQKYNL